MRLVTRTDNKGFKHLYYIKDTDPDTARGMQADPPNVQDLDWQEIIKEIHNGLVEARLVQLNNIRRSNSGLDNIILKPIKQRIIQLYRSNEDD